MKCIYHFWHCDIESREFIVRISSFRVMDFPKLEYYVNALSSQHAITFLDPPGNYARILVMSTLVTFVPSYLLWMRVEKIGEFAGSESRKI